MANMGLAFFGALLTAAGGFAIGYASGYAAAINDIASIITSAVSSIPLIGGAVAGELTNYINQQVSNAVSGYQEIGAVLILIGFIVAVLGARSSKKHPVQSYVPAQMSSPTPTQQRWSACPNCGRAVSGDSIFCSVCGTKVH